MLFLYNIPAWAMGAVIVFATLFVALGGYALFRRAFPVTLDAEQRNMAIAMMTAVTTINSLLVAFLGHLGMGCVSGRRRYRGRRSRMRDGTRTRPVGVLTRAPRPHGAN
ncbi:hypothetical protein ACU4HD_46880 [Cupriavidus basilensis]